jgi:hypothetical protein
VHFATEVSQTATGRPTAGSIPTFAFIKDSRAIKLVVWAPTCNVPQNLTTSGEMLFNIAMPYYLHVAVASN